MKPTKKRSKVTEPTDTERLDWLLTPGNICISYLGRWVAGWPMGSVSRKYKRTAIDAAIRNQRGNK